jgi:hypothetical protein
MADLPQYTGVTYDNAFSRNPEESMYDYMMRLASQRASGVLGGGGMLDTPAAEEVTSAPLGEVQQNCPPGYELRNGACVRVSSGGNYEDMPETKPVVRTAGNNFGLASDTAKTIAAMLPGPLGLLAGAGIAYNDSQAIKAAQEAAGIPEDQRSGTWFKGTEDSIGTRNLNDREYHISIGGMATDPTNNIIENMFGMGNYITTLTPAEAMRRAQPRTYNYLNPEVNAVPMGLPQLPTSPEAQLQRTMGMMDTLNQLNSGSISGGDSGYYSDSTGSYTGGSDYGGWTGVTADGSGNDWDSFGGDDTY